MRTTLTLDDDVAARLKAEARKAGKPFKDVVNEALRAGLAVRRSSPRREPYRVVTRDLGELAPGLSLDNIGDLLERLEGSLHR
jgi:hypothetical protein